MRVLTLIVGMLLTGSVLAQAFPSRPVRFIVPFPPGGATDIIARVLAQKMTEAWGQPVVVENRAGAAGAIGSDAVAKAAPDGHTILMGTTSTHAVNPAINPKLSYNNLTDFTAVTLVATFPNVLVAHPSTAASLQELIATLKKNPGKYNYASSGVCSVLHMMGEQFKISTGTFITHMPYRGSGPALIDLLGGQVEMMFDNLPSSMGHIQSGKIRPIAVAAPKRLEALANVPTFAELGLKEVNDPAWYGLVAPAKTPEAIISRLNAAANKALAMPDVLDKLKQNGAEPAANTPAQHAAEIKYELEKAKSVVKKQNIKFENS